MKKFKEILEKSNPLPKKGDNWFKFAKWAGMGTSDLDNLASELGMGDYKDMELTVDPKQMMKQDPRKFHKAIQKTSSKKSDVLMNQLQFFIKSY